MRGHFRSVLDFPGQVPNDYHHVDRSSHTTVYQVEDTIFVVGLPSLLFDECGIFDIENLFLRQDCDEGRGVGQVITRLGSISGLGISFGGLL